jgi:hypothetical protein
VNQVEQRGAAPRKLSLPRVLLGTFTLTWQHRIDVARTIGIPLLVVIACTLAWNLAAMHVSKSGKWVFYAVYLLANCWLAIVTHRMVLMEEPGKPTQFDKAAWKRLFIFAAVVIALWALHTAMRLTMISVASDWFPSTFGKVGTATRILDSASTWLPFLVMGRLSLMLPAVAIGERLQPVKAARDSIGNSWRLAVIVGVLPWLLDLLVDVLYRNGATRFEFGLLLVLSSFCTVLGVIALSLAYRDLAMVPAGDATSPVPPPNDPPG